jgi:hypothetical protein
MHPSQITGKLGLGIAVGDSPKKTELIQIKQFVENKLPNGVISIAVYLGSWTVAESKKIKAKIEKNNYVMPCRVVLRPNGNSNCFLYVEFETNKPINKDNAMAMVLNKVTDSIL